MSTPSVLIVIPCLNEAAHLPGLLDKLGAEAFPWPHRIVVADGGSTDASQSIVSSAASRHNAISLLDNPERLQAAGINSAVKAFGDGFKFLVRMDAHAVYPAGFVQGLIETATAQQADSVVVPMRTIGGTCFQTAAATAQNSVIGTGGAAHRVGGKSGWVDHGHHALMRLDAFRAVGGYDSRFSHNEDAELDLRFAQLGFRIWMEQALSLDYVPRRTPRLLFRQYVNYGRGRARTIRLHRRRLKLRQALPLAVGPAVAGMIAAVPLGMLHPLLFVLAVPALVWATASVFAGGIVARKSSGACAYAAGPVAMIMHLGWCLGFLRESLGAKRLSQSIKGPA